MGGSFLKFKDYKILNVFPCRIYQNRANKFDDVWGQKKKKDMKMSFFFMKEEVKCRFAYLIVGL